MAKALSKLELQEVLICKTIENNPNGTFSLSGVYPKDVALKTVPAKLIIALWMNFDAKISDKEPLLIKITGKNVLENDIELEVALAETKKTECIPVVIKNISLSIIKSGKISISYKHGKEKWAKVKTIGIEALQPTNSKSAS